jgi:hypothetical protein
MKIKPCLLYPVLCFFFSLTVVSQNFDKETIGFTWYDLQTNGSMQNRIHVFDDGTIGAVWTMGLEWQNYFIADRGTGYNYFNGMDWAEPPVQRIEEVRTGWPGYAPLGDNGEIIISHISDTNSYRGLMIGRRFQKGTGEWTTDTILGPVNVPNQALLFPRMVTVGVNHETIHLLATPMPTSNGGFPYFSQDPPLLYYRSTDMGETWDIRNHIFPVLDSANYLAIPLDCYAWAQPKGDTIAFVVGSKIIDLIVMKSNDNGETWQKTVVWEHPVPFYTSDSLSGDSIYCCDGSSSIALDAMGLIHIAFGIDILFNNGSFFVPGPPDGLAYWNESMPVFEGIKDALNPDVLMQSGNLVGWSQDLNGNGQLDTIDFPWYKQRGMSNMPSLVCKHNNLYLAFSSVTEFFDNGLYNYRHVWFRRSTDNGSSWGNFFDINGGLIGVWNENVFPGLSISDNHLGLIFQTDPDPGCAVIGQHFYIENQIKYVDLSEYMFSITDSPTSQTFDNIVIHPNPSCGVFFIHFPKDLKNKRVNIVDHFGNIISENSFTSETTIRINIDNKPNGVYFAKIQTEDGITTRKIIIKK